jgi:hypothetical protein
LEDRGVDERMMIDVSSGNGSEGVDWITLDPVMCSCEQVTNFRVP